MPITQQSTTTATIQSTGENAEVAALSAQRSQLESTRSGWETALSIALAVTAIAALLIFLFDLRVRRFSGRIEGVQEDIIRAKDRQALADSKDKDQKIAGALQQAGESNKAAAEANERAGKAQSSLASAEQQAAEANAKAEGFRADIAKANESAAQAQAQVAGAMAEAAKANLELEMVKAPRKLSNAAVVTESLKAYKGTEYTFSSVFGDEESILLLRQIDAVLRAAGWIRTKPPHAYPAINVYGQEQDFAVASALTSGVKISANSDTTLAALQAMPVDKLPAPIGAAVALATVLTGGLIPPQEGGVKANVEPGQATTVRIDVGRKP